MWKSGREKKPRDELACAQVGRAEDPESEALEGDELRRKKRRIT